jgi:hypothetical protein
LTLVLVSLLARSRQAASVPFAAAQRQRVAAA